MAHDYGILDTSVVLDLRAIAVEDLPRFPYITAITLAEIAAGPLLADNELERARRQRQLSEVTQSLTVLPFDSAAALAFPLVSASLRTAHRKVSARSYDALIASIALAHDLPLYTKNPRDFEHIDGLTVIALA